MMFKLLVVPALIILFSLAARGGGATDADTLQGTWLPSAAELGGTMFPDEIRKTISLVIAGDKYTVTVGKAVDQGTVKLNPATNPRQLDITGTDGPNKGRTILAIYEREGDTLRVCYDLAGTGRPTEFKTSAGSQLFLVTYKLQTP
ncbi:MAG TPA: TIGR03067 domain-containing protein [Blastocatellia bacterium]|nr:TIGR03067 domain-containing protein [Blastocatellia bacterium]